MKARIVVLVGIFVLGTLSVKAEITMAFVDTEKVLQGSMEFKEVDREARMKIELKEEEGQRMLQEIQKLEEELSVMADSKREMYIKEYQRKIEALDKLREQARDEIMDRQSVDLKRIANKIKNVIEEIAKKKNLTMVLELKPILYLDRTKVIDISPQVIEEINKQYELEKEKLRIKAPKRVK
jgi:Skp family chaperone for outer membrane proteins